MEVMKLISVPSASIQNAIDTHNKMINLISKSSAQMQNTIVDMQNIVGKLPNTFVESQKEIEKITRINTELLTRIPQIPKEVMESFNNINKILSHISIPSFQLPKDVFVRQAAISETISSLLSTLPIETSRIVSHLQTVMSKIEIPTDRLFQEFESLSEIIANVHIDNVQPTIDTVQSDNDFVGIAEAIKSYIASNIKYLSKKQKVIFQNAIKSIEYLKSEYPFFYFLIYIIYYLIIVPIIQGEARSVWENNPPMVQVNNSTQNYYFIYNNLDSQNSISKSFITIKTVKVRENCNNKSRVVTRLDKNINVTKISKHGKWMFVEFKDFASGETKRGYILSKYLKLSE
jgi:hypothetical protein